MSSIRSDYNLLSNFYKRIHADTSFEFSILVSGAHLSAAHGLTVGEIIADRLPIFAKIESLIASDSRAARLKSASILLNSCIDQVAAYKPDLIIYAGDREDVIVGGMLGAFLDIPTLHFFGGDHASDGIVDNQLRHATSKLSSLHFVSTEEHAKRLGCIGELASSVFVVGSPAIDRIRIEPTSGRQELLKKYGVEHWDRFAIVIFHPVLGEEDRGAEYFKNILDALRENNLPAFVSYPNVDSGNQQIVSTIEQAKGLSDFVFYHNLPNADFVGLLRTATMLVGNSSCGIVEAPFLKLAAVNVGRRQTGRASAGNVIFCDNSFAQIKKSIDQAMSQEFIERLENVPSPYGDGYATERAFEQLKRLDWNSYLRKSQDPLGAMK